MYNIDTNELDSSLAAIAEASRPSNDIKEVEGHLGEQNGGEGVDDLVSPTDQLAVPVPDSGVADVNASPEQREEAKGKKKQSRRVITRRARHYLTVAQVKAMPEPSWLLEEFLQSGSLSVLYGPPKVGKSFLALDWGLSIAYGCEWLDCSTGEPKPVLYIAGEGLGEDTEPIFIENDDAPVVSGPHLVSDQEPPRTCRHFIRRLVRPALGHVVQPPCGRSRCRYPGRACVWCRFGGMPQHKSHNLKAV